VQLRPPIWANPLYYLVQTFRDPIYKGEIPEIRVLAASTALAIGVFVSGWVFFCNRTDRYALLS
jgi:ABC-type polysaccharide/polyol phosphate export permease